MNVAKLVINLVLFIAVVFLSFKLYSIIQDPIKFEKKKDQREIVVIKKLLEIKKAQMAYRDLNGEFAKDWGTLIQTIERDSMPEIKIIGNPDDSTIVTVYDTVLVPLKTKVFPQGYDLKQLSVIPFSGGEKFKMGTDKIDVNRVKISVFEVSAAQSQYLKEMNPKYIDNSKSLTLGSLTEGRYTGNWE